MVLNAAILPLAPITHLPLCLAKPKLKLGPTPFPHGKKERDEVRCPHDAFKDKGHDDYIVNIGTIVCVHGGITSPNKLGGEAPRGNAG